MAQHVFVVSDSDETRTILRHILSQAGYDLRVTSSRLMALEALHTSPHRLAIVLDMDTHAAQESENVTWLVQWIAANPALVSRHAYLALSSMPGELSPDVTSLLTKLHAPLLAKPLDMRSLLLLVSEACQRLSGDHIQV